MGNVRKRMVLSDLPHEHGGVVVELFCNRPQLPDLHDRLPRPRRSPDANWVWKHDRSELTIVSPSELRADAVIKRVRPGSDDPELVVIFEVQRDRKEGKRRSWAMYLASAAYRYKCRTVLVVVCPDPVVAAWAREEFRTNVGDGTLQPIVIGPDDVPVNPRSEGRGFPGRGGAVRADARGPARRPGQAVRGVGGGGANAAR